MKSVVQTLLFQKVALRFFYVFIADGGLFQNFCTRNLTRITTDLHRRYSTYWVVFKGNVGAAVSDRNLNNFQNYIWLCESSIRKKIMILFFFVQDFLG